MKVINRSEYVRPAHLGGSDAAAALGLSPWRSPLEVWLEKTGKGKPQPETEAMSWGSLIEPAISDRYATLTNRCVWNTSKVFLSDSGVLAASVDRLVTESRKVQPVSKYGLRIERLLEVKTSRRKDDWGEPGTDDIPVWYQTQVRQYMGLLKASVCDVAVLFGGSELAIYSVNHDPELWGRLSEALEKWWRDHVIANKPPEPRSAADVEKLFPASAARSVVADEGAEKAAIELVGVRSELERLALREQEIKNGLCVALGDADTLVRPDGTALVTWKTTKARQRIDWKGVAAELAIPAKVIEKFTTEAAGSRQFLLKLKGEGEQ
jgi:putative phage-type endonuclease